jgi:hypothetical protein
MSRRRILGVHGIAQQQLGRKQLLRAWAPALSDGVELAAGVPVAEPPFDLAFYGHAYLQPSGTKGSEMPDDPLSDLSPEEHQDLTDAAGEALTREELAAAQALPPTKAYTRTPKPLQAILRGLDAKFGAAAGVLYVGTLRQVRRYLCEPDLKATIDQIVDDAMARAARSCWDTRSGRWWRWSSCAATPSIRWTCSSPSVPRWGCRWCRHGCPSHGSAPTQQRGVPTTSRAG